VSTKSKIIFKISERIKILRTQKGLTQEELSKRSQVDYKHIQLLESKKPPAIKIDTLEKIVHGFGLELYEFFNDDVFKLKGISKN
jgi:transcriptional regulator with XRE-family HTH domain